MVLSVAGVFLAGTAISSAQAAGPAPAPKKAATTQEVVTNAALGCLIVGGIVAIVTHGIGTVALASCAGGAAAGVLYTTTK